MGVAQYTIGRRQPIMASRTDVFEESSRPTSRITLLFGVIPGPTAGTRAPFGQIPHPFADIFGLIAETDWLPMGTDGLIGRTERLGADISRLIVPHPHPAGCPQTVFAHRSLPCAGYAGVIVRHSACLPEFAERVAEAAASLVQLFLHCRRKAIFELAARGAARVVA